MGLFDDIIDGIGDVAKDAGEAVDDLLYGDL